MIKALILIQLWSLVVAGAAWLLQRDGSGKVGASFPSPNVWLILIILSILPGALYFIPLGSAVTLPDLAIFDELSTQVGGSGAEQATTLNYLAIYLVVGLLLIASTLLRWSRLQRLPLAPTAEPGVYTTTTEVPPLTLSWPRRAVVIPGSGHMRSPLLRHERAHLHHNDAELTLLLLLLRDLMLRTPGFSYLIRQWRLSIELRADRAATHMLTTSERKAYATLLLSAQRPGQAGGISLPCPTARLGSSRHRSVKMRLGNIMANDSGAPKRRWGAALLLTSVLASGIGLISAAASANVAGYNPDDYVVLDYINKRPLQLPASCPGLESDLKRAGVKFEEQETTVNGQFVSLYSIKLGTVVLGHDVRADGSVFNTRVLDSTHRCFDAQAKAHINQLMTQPQEAETQNVAAKLVFKMFADSPEELSQKLKEFL